MMQTPLKNKRKNKNRGFSLLEVIISLGIAVVLLSLIITLYSALQSAQLKQQAIAEVEGQGLSDLTLIAQTVRNAQSVTVPATSTSAVSLSLTTYLASTTPTVFDMSAGVLRIKEGLAALVPLTNSQVVVSSLTFQNLSRALTSGTVKFQFTLTYASTTKQFDTIYAKTFYGSATIRRLQQ
jgi:prepilin-type N-terminal cleavage/methylation domain-containing protein